MKSIKSCINLFVLSLILTLVVSACGGDDEETPQNRAPIITDQSFSVAENIDDEVAIGLVQASDPDEDDISFSITEIVEANDNRDFSGLFEIDETTGALSLIAGESLDFEDASGFSLTVSVSDTELTATASVTITVTDVNRAPIITDQSFSVAENIDDEEIIGTVQASDPDRNALSFSITEIVEANGNRDFSGLFEIDETTGALSLTAGESLDFEDASAFSVTVSVSDTELTATASITITVTDVEEMNPMAFVTTWRTTTANETISFDTNSNLTYDYNVDWGDGTTETNLRNSPSHTYATPGDYQVAITGTFPAIQTNGATQIISIDQWGVIEWETMQGAFASSRNVVENASDAPDLSRVTSLSGMFADCFNFKGDLGNWDVSNVTNMSEMFRDAEAFNGDIKGWNVSNVTDMNGMFHGASVFNQDIGSWDVSNVISIERIFNRAKAFNQDIGSWNVSNVTNMGSMLTFARSFNQGIGSWDVSNVTNMSDMFWAADSFNQDIGNWDVSNVTNMRVMFHYADAFNQDITSWDVSNVTDMVLMFAEAGTFNQDIGSWDVSKVTDMWGMFAESGTFNQDIGSWDVSNVTDMRWMFRNATTFNQDLNRWNVASVTQCTDFSRSSALAAANRPNFTNCDPD